MADGVTYVTAQDFYIDNVSVYEFDVTISEIIEESNYYPFGLKHKGYNNVISSNGNSTAQKFKYNGKEFEEVLGLNLYEMDMRQYDPAIARWTAIDPVIHHNVSTYNAFDNNPVYWADPSGADAEWTGDFGLSATENRAMKHAQALFNAQSNPSKDSTSNLKVGQATSGGDNENCCNEFQQAVNRNRLKEEGGLIALGDKNHIVKPTR